MTVIMFVVMLGVAILSGLALLFFILMIGAAMTWQNEWESAIEDASDSLDEEATRPKKK